METKIIAHRGYSQKYPENTIVSFQKAKEFCADGIELDVHMTRDAALVVHHDYYIEKTKNDRQLIFAQNLDQIKNIDIGSRFNEEYAGQRVSTLQEVFSTIGKNMHYEIEMRGFTTEFIHKVITVVREFDITNNVEFTSSHVALLIRLKLLYPDVKTGFFVQTFPSWMDRDLGRVLLLNNLKMGMFAVAHCPLAMIDSDLVSLLKENSFLVHAADCNSDDDIRNAYQLGVDHLSTNNLETAIKLRYEITRK